MDDASNDTTQRSLRLQLLLKLFSLFYLIVYIALDIALIIIGFTVSRKCDDQPKGFPFNFWIILTGIGDICILQLEHHQIRPMYDKKLIAYDYKPKNENEQLKYKAALEDINHLTWYYWAFFIMALLVL
eukprot:380352_1